MLEIQMGSIAMSNMSDGARVAKIDMLEDSREHAHRAGIWADGDEIIDQSALEENWRTRERLTDAQWSRIVRVLPGRVGARAGNGGNARLFVEAVLWVAHTQAYWSDIPPEYGAWHSNYIRFVRWAKEGHWADVVMSMEELPESQRLLASMVNHYLVKHRMNRMRVKIK